MVFTAKFYIGYSDINKDYNLVLDKLANEGQNFDIIFLDPPYKLNLINECLNEIIEYNFTPKGDK